MTNYSSICSNYATNLDIRELLAIRSGTALHLFRVLDEYYPEDCNEINYERKCTSAGRLQCLNSAIAKLDNDKLVRMTDIETFSELLKAFADGIELDDTKIWIHKNSGKAYKILGIDNTMTKIAGKWVFCVFYTALKDSEGSDVFKRSPSNFVDKFICTTLVLP